MKAKLSAEVEIASERSAKAGVQGHAALAPLLAPAWAVRLALQQHEPGAARNQVRTGRRLPSVAPSLRLRVTASNRALLRWLRGAELAAWQDADAPLFQAPNDFQA